MPRTPDETVITGTQVSTLNLGKFNSWNKLIGMLPLYTRILEINYCESILLIVNQWGVNPTGNGGPGGQDSSVEISANVIHVFPP